MPRLDDGSIPHRLAPGRIADAASHLRAELSRVVRLLELRLELLRRRGRTPAADAVRGLVIEDGEAEGLIAGLTADWGGDARGNSGAWDRNEWRSREDGGDISASRRGVADAEPPRWDLPLHRARLAFNLRDSEYPALLLALAVEVDARFGRLVAYLNDHVGHTRPTVGLAFAVGNDGAAEPPPVASPLALCDRPVVRDGLLEIEGDGPMPGLTVRLPLHMAARLSGELAPDAAPEGVALLPQEPGLLDRMVLEDPTRAALRAWGQALRSGRPVPPLVLAGADGCGRATAARAAVSEAGLPLVAVEARVGELGCEAGARERLTGRFRAARREARWHRAALLLRVTGEGRSAAAPQSGDATRDGTPCDLDWQRVWEALADQARPLLIAASPAAAQSIVSAAPAGAEPAVVTLAPPPLALRAALWRAMLPAGMFQSPSQQVPGTPPTNAAGAGRDLCDDLAARFRFNPGRTAQAVRRARAAALLRPPGQRRLSAELIWAACRDVGAAAMGPLARKLPLPYAWDDLVVPDAVRDELKLALAWVRQQGKVMDEWGFGRRIVSGRGLTCLFGGPPGTGKTMAAQVLGRELGLDVYSVDVSQVMDKYIGETEKKLARLFDEAEACSAVLFFDEADALFGKRSEVSDAHDRYANVQIAYLLQRMEQYEGVTVLATNRARDLDEAFTRRFHFIVDFPMPDEAGRLAIWRGMFPPATERDPQLDADLPRVARDFELSGGEIRNIVLASAHLAAAEGRARATGHVRRAIRREFAKNGRVLDDSRFDATDRS